MQADYYLLILFSNYNLFFIPDKRVRIDIDRFLNNFYYARIVKTIIYIDGGADFPSGCRVIYRP